MAKSRTFYIVFRYFTKLAKITTQKFDMINLDITIYNFLHSRIDNDLNRTLENILFYDISPYWLGSTIFNKICV